MSETPSDLKALPYTPSMCRVLAVARKESEKLGRSYVQSDALLLALLTATNGVTPGILKALGLDGEMLAVRVREEMRKVTTTAPHSDLVRLSRRSARHHPTRCKSSSPISQRLANSSKR